MSLSATTDTSVVSVSAVSTTSTSGYLAEHPAYSKLNASFLALGDYLIGDTDDNMISGHPDIRY